MNNIKPFKIAAVIPSRYGSKRFEGKPLAHVAGKPMIQRVYEQALKAENIDIVIVATDDERIFKAVEQFGGKALLTDSSLRSGTDRAAKAADILGLEPDDIVVNIQGDQPVFNPICISQMTAPFKSEPELLMSTLACKITNLREITDPKDVKVVIDKNGYALYFSRSQIPFPRDGLGLMQEDVSPERQDALTENQDALTENQDTLIERQDALTESRINQNNLLIDQKDRTFVDYYKHLGFYAYKKSFLDKIASLPEGYLEKIEKLEQLRVIENSYRIKVVITEYDSPEVDIPEDIKRIEKNLFNLQLNPK